MAILGAGNLGLALADYPGFRQEGFPSSPSRRQRSKIGQWSRGGVRIHDMASSAIGQTGPDDIAVWPCRRIRPGRGQHGRAGRRSGDLNFSPGTLKVPPDVKLKNVV